MVWKMQVALDIKIGIFNSLREMMGDAYADPDCVVHVLFDDVDPDPNRVVHIFILFGETQHHNILMQYLCPAGHNTHPINETLHNIQLHILTCLK